MESNIPQPYRNRLHLAKQKIAQAKADFDKAVLGQKNGLGFKELTPGIIEMLEPGKETDALVARVMKKRKIKTHAVHCYVGEELFNPSTDLVKAIEVGEKAGYGLHLSFWGKDFGIDVSLGPSYHYDMKDTGELTDKCLAICRAILIKYLEDKEREQERDILHARHKAS